MRGIELSFFGKAEKYATMLFAGFLSIFVISFFCFALHHSFWGDETHFTATIRRFGSGISLDLVSDYDQVIGPLFFIMYAFWGRLAGFDVASLRLLSILFSVAVLSLIYFFYSSVLGKKSLALLGLFLFLLNPYVWGLGFFVFTDIPSLFFLLICAAAIYKRKPAVLLIAVAAAMLCRQYSVYLVCAAGVYFLCGFVNGEKGQIKNILALSMGLLPFLFFVCLWKGIAPPSGVRRWVIEGAGFYNVDYITTYITFMAIYLLPALLLIWRFLLARYEIIVLSIILSCWYFIFPVRPSTVVAIQTNYDTVGLIHRLIKSALKTALLENIFLWFMFFVGLLFLTNIARYDFKRLKNKEWDFPQFLTLSVIAFILIMPLSYQLWEKYLVAVLPFALLRILILRSDGEFTKIRD